MREIKHLELFAGIGGFHRAFDLLGKDYKFLSTCIGFSEIDKYASMTYKANYDVSNTLEMGDITKFNEDIKNIKTLPNFDILTGGFPCQSFSMMGKQAGFEDTRGTLFFDILEILEVKKTKFVLLENVRNLLTHDNKNTIKTIVASLKEIGYKFVYYDIFNTKDFELAHKRQRIYIFASRVKLSKNFTFTSNEINRAFIEINTIKSTLFQNDILDVLDKEVDQKYFLSERIKPTILADGSAGYKGHSTINNLLAKPLTATMVKMHRACQDNYYSTQFLESKNPYEYVKKEYTKSELQKHNIRKLTPKEALKLQGFSEDFYNQAYKHGLSDHQLLKQAGNAASVNVIYAILYYLIIENNILGEK